MKPEPKQPTQIRLVGFCRICWKRYTYVIPTGIVYKIALQTLLKCCKTPDPVVTDSFLL